MKLTEISIENFRSITSIKNVKIFPTQALLGENNAGKSNVLYAIDAYLSAGSGGINESDFQDKTKPIIIAAKFSLASPNLKKIWRPYMINDELILEKHIWIEEDARTNKETIKNEFHGYQAEPKQWFLSIKKIKEQKGDRPKWKDIVSENSLPDYFLNNDSCTKDDYGKGLEKYFQENDIEYDEPDLSATQALGFQSKAISNLPKFYLLRAETNYSDETDKRSSTSTFRKLMADLTDRIIKNDPKYQKIEDALKTVNNLLNETKTESTESNGRLDSLATIEDSIKKILCNLMPSVEKVKLKVATEDVTAIFSKGVEITVDDGVETDVLLKGHGLQRCIIFSLLQALILNERNQLVSSEGIEELNHPIILGIEEPELYIHPQLGKLFYDVLNSFADKDQVIYTTHSPRFIDVYKYDSIALIKKTKSEGTKFINCDQTAFDGLIDRKVFQGLTQLNTDVNELFFAKNVLVVEGPEDKIAITETIRKLGKIKMRIEEVDVTIIAAGGKQSIPFFVRVLNAFKINYAVLHDLDIEEGMPIDSKNTEESRNKTIADLAPQKVITFPIKLENTLGLEKGHLKDQYEALSYFSDHSNINSDLENIIKQATSLVGIKFE
ncbi:ATP-dependent endonuclease [Candidatus Giovannonibacteria bacterium]|nr:ATP-dependent endonuclease [Candidatus Giovannonibacteria bacterium]